jgi:hypothetical protein
MHHYDPVVRTRTLARVVGPCLVAVGAALYLRGDTMPEFLFAFMQDSALVFVAGVFTLMAGLGVLSAHRHWSSISAAMISFIGVAAALKGASLMIAPSFGAELTDAVVRRPIILQAAVCLELLLGLWLCFVGWMREHFVFAFALNR